MGSWLKGPFLTLMQRALRSKFLKQEKIPRSLKTFKIVFLKSHPGHIVNCFTVNTFAVIDYKWLQQRLLNHITEKFSKRHRVFSARWRSWNNYSHRQKSRTFRARYNYQRYIVLHSGTIEYQENSIWRRSRLDRQRSVFRTMTYTIWAPQTFYLMKGKRKEYLQVNLWDFSRQSDDLM